MFGERDQVWCAWKGSEDMLRERGSGCVERGRDKVCGEREGGRDRWGVWKEKGEDFGVWRGL